MADDDRPTPIDGKRPDAPADLPPLDAYPRRAGCSPLAFGVVAAAIEMGVLIWLLYFR